MGFHLTPGLFFIFAIALQESSCTNRPIIGVLAQEMEDSQDSYIAASYVKAVEASGARVVPIFLKKDDNYYRELLTKLNGVVLPGGNSKLGTKGGYYEIASNIFTIALQMNKLKGIKFPILGVCEGFEVLAVASNKMRADTLSKCSGMEGVMLPLVFTKDFKRTSLYQMASDDIIFTLATRNITANFHDWCLRPDTPLKLPWRILSTNLDKDNKPFVSSMQYKSFAAVQFHPEKNSYEWGKNLPSDKDALVATRYFYDWLVTEARRNNNSFSSSKEESDAVIYNYSPKFTGRVDGFQQFYYFHDDPSIINSVSYRNKINFN